MYCKSLEVLDIFCYVGLLISCVCTLYLMVELSFVQEDSILGLSFKMAGQSEASVISKAHLSETI